MSSWAKEALGRVFSARDSRRASETTSSSKSRIKTLVGDEDGLSRRRISLTLVNAASWLKPGSRARARASSLSTHRRVQSQPQNSPTKMARLCYKRSYTQSNLTSQLPDHVVPIPQPVDPDEEPDHKSPAVTAHDVQRATRRALEHPNDPPLRLHDPAIEWQPPTWDDLWRDTAKSIRTHSSGRFSTLMRPPKGGANQDRGSPTTGRRNRSVSRKSSFEDLRSSVQPQRDSSSSGPASNLPTVKPERHTSIKRSSLQKQLPNLPSHTMLLDASKLPASYLQENAARNARIVKSLQDDGVLDLRDSEDTHTAVIWSPTVTHETRIVQPVELVRRAVSREIHNHHFVHGVLPIVDLQVLPARHFWPDGHGGYVEISEDQIPGGKPDSLDELIAEAVSKSASKRPSGVVSPRGDKGQRTDSSGESEQWWMHYPRVTSPILQDRAGQAANKPLEKCVPKSSGSTVPSAHPVPELKSSKPESSTEKGTSPRALDAAQRTSRERAAEIAEERARHPTFQYCTPDGLPSWTAITTEPPLDRKPAAPEKSQRLPQPFRASSATSRRA